MNNERHYYHGASLGLESEILFSSIQEFIAGMNRMAICRLLFPEVFVFAYCLMDNHIHVILYGSYDDCQEFLRTYKKLTGMWLNNHGRSSSFLNNMELDLWFLPDREKLIEKLAYVYRNPVAAHLPFSAQGYRWSTASLQFADHSRLDMLTKSVGDLSIRSRWRLFESRVEIPGNWRYFDDGLIWPGYYVEVERVNTLFSTPQNYQFHLNKNVEIEVNLEMEAENLYLPDSELVDFRNQMVGQLFGKKIKDLSVEERIGLAKAIKKAKGCSYKQIARLVHLPLGTLKRVV